MSFRTNQDATFCLFFLVYPSNTRRPGPASRQAIKARMSLGSGSVTSLACSARFSCVFLFIVCSSWHHEACFMLTPTVCPARPCSASEFIDVCIDKLPRQYYHTTMNSTAHPDALIISTISVDLFTLLQDSALDRSALPGTPQGCHYCFLHMDRQSTSNLRAGTNRYACGPTAEGRTISYWCGNPIGRAPVRPTRQGRTRNVRRRAGVECDSSSPQPMVHRCGDCARRLSVPRGGALWLA